MKTIKFTIAILFFFPFITYSQGFYFSVGGGYGFNTSSINNIDLCEGITNDYNSNLYYNQIPPGPFVFIGNNETFTENEINGSAPTWSESYQNLNKGFGGGLTFYATVGYAFTKYLSAELGFSYLAGSTLQSNYNSSSTSIYPFDTNYSNETINSTLKSSARYRFLPAVKFSIPMKKFTPYIKAGLVMGLGGQLTVNNDFSETGYFIENGMRTINTPVTEFFALNATGGISLGYIGAAGVEYALSDFISLFLEATLINESWSPSKGDITQFQVNAGNTQPYVLSNTQFNYSDNFSIGGSTNNSNSYLIAVNNNYPKQTVSYDSWGLTAGIKLSFAKPKPKTEPAAKQQ